MTRRVFIIARLRVDKPVNVTGVEAKLRLYQDAVLRDFIPFFQKYYLSADLAGRRHRQRAPPTAAAHKVYGDMVPEVLLINVFEQANPRQR